VERAVCVGLTARAVAVAVAVAIAVAVAVAVAISVAIAVAVAVAISGAIAVAISVAALLGVAVAITVTIASAVVLRAGRAVVSTASGAGPTGRADDEHPHEAPSGHVNPPHTASLSVDRLGRSAPIDRSKRIESSDGPPAKRSNPLMDRARSDQSSVTPEI